MKQRPTTANQDIKALREEMTLRLKETSIHSEEILQNLALYMNRHLLQKILVLDSIYKNIINTHGVIMEFGVRWGQNLSLFQNFRSIYEPYNFNRKIIGFDTFEGFKHISDKDGRAPFIKEGAYDVSFGYENELNSILAYHENESPYAHIKKFELVKGDATATLKEYLDKYPETIISLAYFDFDIYHPTKVCLEMILPHLIKGSVVVFDELNLSDFPGETIALMETELFKKYAIKRFPTNPYLGYLIID